jgi:hypothetical protein
MMLPALGDLIVGFIRKLSLVALTWAFPYTSEVCTGSAALTAKTAHIKTENRAIFFMRSPLSDLKKNFQDAIFKSGQNL